MAENVRTRVAKIKNKQAAPIQITAEQLLYEANDRLQQPARPARPIRPDESDGTRLHRRKTFEDALRRNKHSMSTWLRYAAYELSQQDLPRARSVFERALDIDPYNSTVYLKYIEMEMSARNINHTRNLFDRVTALLPRQEQFWYKYVHMEEQLGHVALARQIFERWLQWEPEIKIYFSFVQFEQRYKEWQRVRAIYEKLLTVHGTQVTCWVRYARFEEEMKCLDAARAIFQRAMDFFETAPQVQLFISFAQLEARLKEVERARTIYQVALQIFQAQDREVLLSAYSSFERQNGDATGSSVDSAVLEKRRAHYEKLIEKEPRDYDSWFAYAQLEETALKDLGENVPRIAQINRIRDIYKRALEQEPEMKIKNHWRRFIYLGLFCAVFEELQAQDMQHTEATYRLLLKMIPHSEFTFAKVWILYAQFLMRRHEWKRVRQVLGEALGRSGGKRKLFRFYIDLEMQLRQFDRCRILYERFLLFSPITARIYVQYAEMEQALGDVERARAILEMALKIQELDTPLQVWKCFIELEKAEGEQDRVRALFERLLERDSSLQVWLAYLEAEKADGETASIRALFERAEKSLRSDTADHRLALLHDWRTWEMNVHDTSALSRVDALMPRRVKKRRRVQLDDESSGWEEYYDWLFPSDEDASKQPHLQLLAMAHQWKQNLHKEV